MVTMGLSHAANYQFGDHQVQRLCHPVLSNAIYLWASFLSRPGPLSLNEQMFLSQTQSALVDALNVSQHQPQSSPRILQQDISRVATLSPPSFAHTISGSTIASAPVVMDTIQAAVLLSRYFFSIGRLHEASYYSNAAASLTIQSGLHQINSSLAIAISQQQQVPAFAGLSAVYSSALRLPPPQDGIELGERINLFWQVFVLDRLLSVALRRSPTIIDDDSVETRIDTPWPEDVEEYEHVSGLLHINNFICHRLTCRNIRRHPLMQSKATGHCRRSSFSKPSLPAHLGDFPFWHFELRHPHCTEPLRTYRRIWG